MKMNKVLGAAVLAGALSIISAFSVFAAESFTVGKPIDLSTGEEATSIAAGQHIALPVDVNTDNGKMAGFGFFVSYDSALTPGVATADAKSIAAVAKKLGVLTKQGSVYTMIDGVYEIDPIEETKAALADVSVSNPNYDGSKFMVANTYNVDTDCNASSPEFYLLFTASSDFDSSKLNASLITIDEENTVLKATNDKDSSSVPTEIDKYNKCGAAFKLVLDSETMDYYVHSLTLKVNGVEKGKITEYVENGKKFEFPVRLIGTAPETVSITVEAETGTATEIKGTKTLIDNQALTLNPTDYAEF